jgi:hypothetical protein
VRPYLGMSASAFGARAEDAPNTPRRSGTAPQRNPAICEVIALQRMGFSPALYQA